MKEIIHAKRLCPKILRILFAEGWGSKVETYEFNLGYMFSEINWEETTVNYTKKDITFYNPPYFLTSFSADCFYDLVRGQNETKK